MICGACNVDRLDDEGGWLIVGGIPGGLFECPTCVARTVTRYAANPLTGLQVQMAQLGEEIEELERRIYP